LACSGLEHAQRGYESFARECFETLRDEPLLDMWLVKGSGASGDRERAIPSIKRDDLLVRLISRGRTRAPLIAEQLAFALSLQPEVVRTRPDVIYFSEWYTGVGLNWLRRVNRGSYALVLSNGSMAAEGFEPFDRVHQHTAPALDFVLARGADPAKHILLPVAFDVPSTLDVVSSDERAALREAHGLPRDRRIVISVAALNSWHKRLDYLITEVASMPEPRPYVLLVGQPEAETEGLRRLADERLGPDGCSFRTVPRREVDALLRASDGFILASLGEGLPRALVEAAAFGLPCYAHDYDVARYALGGLGRLADFTKPGALAGLLSAATAEEDGADAARARHRHVYESFSWDSLRPQYVDMLHGAKGRADFTGKRPG
jgi:glycosyltransferase involved in cell wall biosynthesis